MPSWNLVFQNKPELKDILELNHAEGGFVGKKEYDSYPMGNATRDFQDLQAETDEIIKKLQNVEEDIELDKEQTTRQIDCMSKAVKQL